MRKNRKQWRALGAYVQMIENDTGIFLASCILSDRPVYRALWPIIWRGVGCRFTHESMDNNVFHFLDLKFVIDKLGQFNTSVYIKPTDKGLYRNYIFYIPDTQKINCKNLVFRAIKYSSSWISFNSEINRIKQVLVNNGFTLLIMDSIIQRSLHKYMTINDDSPKDPITFYVQLSNLHTMKLDERALSNILHQHVMPTGTDQKIKLISHFRPN